MHSTPGPVEVPRAKGLKLPEPVFPQYPEKLSDPGPGRPPEKRDWTLPLVYRAIRGWLYPYIRSRILPGDFHSITVYDGKKKRGTRRLCVPPGKRDSVSSASSSTAGAQNVVSDGRLLRHHVIRCHHGRTRRRAALRHRGRWVLNGRRHS